jgi:serine/threonine protein phosphatase 1
VSIPTTEAMTSAPVSTLPEQLRIYAVGDIHGRFDLLQGMAAAIMDDSKKASPAQILEIFLGDFVDRGPQSRQVVEWLIGTPLAGERVCLLGNHEDMLLKSLDDTSWMSNWLYNGATETLLSYGVRTHGIGGSGLVDLQHGLRAALPARHLEFFATLRRIFVVGPYVFVHAGIRPDRSLEDQDPNDFIWIREPFLQSDTDFGFVVVHGHTPTERPDVRRNRINIDTGAVFSGCLTCLVLEGATRRFLQVESD